VKTKPLSQPTKPSARAAIGAGRPEQRAATPAVPVAFATAEPFIKKPEVAKRLGCSIRTVGAMMRRGRIPYYKFNSYVAFRWSEITEHLAQTCRVCPTTNPKAETLKF
jgi:excisionase family DNA binding protein